MKPFLFVAIAAVGGFAAVPGPSTTPDTGIEQDPALVAALGSVAVVDFSDVNLVLTDDAGAVCEWAEADGCYDSNTRTAYVGTIGDDEPATSVVAHEFLHHVWVRDDLAADDALVAALASLDTPGSLLALAIDDHYRQESGEASASERFAYACVKLKPAQLDDVVSSACARYLDIAALPISQTFTADEIVAVINERRTTAGVAPMTVNAGGVLAAQARLDTFTSTDQSSIGSWPDSITTHLDGCNPVDQAILLTDYRGPVVAVNALDEAAGGALSSPARTSVGVAVREFEMINGEIDAADVASDVNMTVIVAMACA